MVRVRVELFHERSSSASSGARRAAESKPMARARARASVAASALLAVSSWLMSLAAAPVPGWPIRTT